MSGIPGAGAAVDFAPVPITTAEFAWLTQHLREQSGIELKPGKEALVTGRLERRLRHHGLFTYTEYFRFITSPEGRDEARTALDLLTTNETYFFREPLHFEQLPQLLPLDRRDEPIRAWSAASSTGEEAYTIAITLAERLGSRPWQVVGTDISTRVLAKARRGLYPLDAASKIPQNLLQSYCLKGRGEYAGYFTIAAKLRQRVEFLHANLTRPLPNLGRFDIVFLRNVMIYFSAETKQYVVRQIAETIRPGGHLLIGHAESLTGLDVPLEQVAPSVYRRPT